jgi:hypothetical protein
MVPFDSMHLNYYKIKKSCNPSTAFGGRGLGRHKDQDLIPEQKTV